MADIIWRETWPDEGEEDYTATDGSFRVGRIYQNPAVNREHWMFFSWFGSNITGTAHSRREAMLATEELYEAWRREKS